MRQFINMILDVHAEVWKQYGQDKNQMNEYDNKEFLPRIHQIKMLSRNYDLNSITRDWINVDEEQLHEMSLQQI